VATAHTLDDQAETVLMKALRGAGTRGLSGIFPEQRQKYNGSVVRPLLAVHRSELREYMQSVGQNWREDLSNSDLTFTRNRVRAQVLPILREQLNPAVDSALAHLAEITRAEEEYWREQIERLLPLVVSPGKPTRGGGRRQTAGCAIAFDVQKLQSQPLAAQRRLLRAGAEQLGCNLDFDHVQAILELLASRSARGRKDSTVEIADGWRARMLFRELKFERALDAPKAVDYVHRLSVPGETHVPELRATLRACTSESNGCPENAAYNRAHSIQLPQVEGLVIRNWRPGDRFQPALHTSEKRVKELLYPLHLSLEEKASWPVVVAGERIVWVRGIESPELLTAAGQRFWIEESTE
jgi:tRNA(Ile)-lysidine synthase